MIFIAVQNNFSLVLLHSLVMTRLKIIVPISDTPGILMLAAAKHS
jgi:hypothetical protein